MAKQQATKKVNDIDESELSKDSNIIDEYKELNQKVDRVLEKISARKKISQKNNHLL